MAFKRGQKVWAQTLEHDGPRVGHVATPEPNDDGKIGVQVGDGLHGLAYNEPGAGEEQGGGTFSAI